MMILNYIEEIKYELITLEWVTSMTIIEEKILEDCGYFRAKLTLTNNDFLEIAEYFILRDEDLITERYRYQWMDETKTQLRRRWDNIPHFPNLDNFPHHVHIETEKNVHPSQSLSILQVLSLIQSLL
jgi:hypothetical protein